MWRRYICRNIQKQNQLTFVSKEMSGLFEDSSEEARVKSVVGDVGHQARQALGERERGNYIAN